MITHEWGHFQRQAVPSTQMLREGDI